MREIAELIQRLEKATGPDVELDHALGMLVGVGGDYTRSIDAALTLVPEPAVKSDGGRMVDIRLDERRNVGFATVNYDFSAQGATPAIALCIAALKARAALIEPLTPVAHGTQAEQANDGEAS